MAAQSVADAGVIERGPDFAVYQQVTTSLAADGQTRFHTNRFTLLENGLNYQDENGAWQESRDLIEPFAEGAVARYGPNKAIFSPELNAAAVFDIQMADGGRLRGGVRAIQLTDLATGRSVALGSVKKSAPGELLPPDRIVYRDAFEGIQADVVLVWRHNQFLQDVVLRQRPALPEGWKPDEVRLEVVTEFVECPDPELRSQSVGREGEEKLEDHTVVDFGGMAILKGHAFPVDSGDAWAFDGGMPTEAQTPVLKQFHELPDGRRFLVESVAWTEAEGQWADLALNAHPESATGEDAAPVEPVPAGTVEGDETSRLAATTISVQKDGAASSGAVDTPRRTWPAPRPPSPERQPIELAQMPYKPEGYLVDFAFVTVSGGNPTVFQTGWTYYVKTSYYSGSSVTFQSGATIKFKNNAYLLLYGPVSFPSSGDAVVFTSRNDDQHGAVIRYVPNEDDSDGNPTMHMASVAVWIYYVNLSTTIQDARIMWAQKGVRYDVNPGVNFPHHLSGSHFECCENGVYAALQSATLDITDVTKCSMFGPPVVNSGYGTISGNPTTPPGCQVESVAWVNDPTQDTTTGDPNGDPNKNTQSECSFVLADNNRVVAAFWDTHLSAYGLGTKNEDFTGLGPIRSTGWAVSYDSGVSFNDQGALLPMPPTTAWEGDAGDPVMARDETSGDIYLLVNPSRENSPLPGHLNTWFGFRLWKSVNNGSSFTPVNTDVFGGSVSQGDKPMIAVSSSGVIYAAGKGTLGGTNEVVVAARSSNGGTSWDPPDLLDSDPGASSGAEIVIGTTGHVYVLYLHEASNTYTLRYRWLHNGAWKPSIGTIPAHQSHYGLFSVGRSGSGDPKRSNQVHDEDYFHSNGYPRAAVNPSTGLIYVVFTDLPEADPGEGERNPDRGDIFVQEAIVNQQDGSLTWLANGAVRVNQDNTETDQWLPSIAISDNTLFIGYYSRQDRPDDNDLLRAYGVKADISNGLGSASFDTFPISPALFPPLYPGPRRYNLSLESVTDPSEIPISGTRLVVVALDTTDDTLHFRVFDENGDIVLDNSEDAFSDKSSEIAALETLLAPLWDEQTSTWDTPTCEQEGAVINTVRSITGQAGSVEVTPPCEPWKYDHVFPQAGVCLDTYARYSGSPVDLFDCSGVPTLDLYRDFMADDYTWAAADANYFYFAWCDRSRSCSLPGGGRPDSNVRLARIVP
ncbi:MAG: exo-alpha-sialidase [Verrucomicrobiales bacterium]|nr:exo-alpha-sialidase [Verrucomicrobiales bacterium]